jgi:hypothetical protein
MVHSRCGGMGGLGFWGSLWALTWLDKLDYTQRRAIAHKHLGLVADTYGDVTYEDGRPITQQDYNRLMDHLMVDIDRKRANMDTVAWVLSILALSIPALIILSRG